MDRRLMCVLLLGNRFGLRSDARSGSSVPRLKLWSVADEAKGPVLRGGGDDEAVGPGGSRFVVVDNYSVVRVKPSGGGVGVVGQHGM